MHRGPGSGRAPERQLVRKKLLRLAKKSPARFDMADLLPDLQSMSWAKSNIRSTINDGTDAFGPINLAAFHH